MARIILKGAICASFLLACAVTQTDASAVSRAPAECTFTYSCAEEPLPNTNCETCETDTTCATCKPGHALDKETGACFSCVENCADPCTSDSDPMKCGTCKKGFVRVVTWDWEDSGVKSEGEGDCSRARDSCFNCAAANCAQGHCKPTGDGFPGGCDACPKGSVPVRPMERDEGDKPYVCSIQKGCTGCPDTCVNPSKPQCASCPTGYGFKDNKGVRNECQKCTVENCSTCAPNKADQCTQCATGFNLVDNKCVSSSECPDAHCTLCDATGYCTSCMEGWYYNAGKCSPNSDCGVKNCVDCLAQGDGVNDKCFTCASGYYGNDRGTAGAGWMECLPCPDGCAQCEADDNGKVTCTADA